MGATVVIAGRNATKTAAAAARIVEETGNLASEQVPFAEGALIPRASRRMPNAVSRCRCAS